MDGVIGTALSWLFSSFMIIGVVLPYVPQYMTMSSKKSMEGFSTKVCLVLLLANIMRIAFWFGHPFETPLLLQSILTVIAMVGLMELCARLEPQTQVKHKFLDFEADFFWRWSNFEDYLQFLAAFACVIGVLTAAYRHSYVFMEGLGLAALLTEALLAAPQFWHNYQSKSTAGMSITMVLLWLTGDVAKSIYFIANQAPLQFWMCGFTQIGLDVAILLQVATYTGET